MKVTDLELDGLKLIEPRVFGDERGYFFESYNRAVFSQAGIDVEFVQDNQSCSCRGVVRGLHFQLPPYTQAKLIRVLSGKIYDVVVDIRVGSPTFGRHHGIELDAESHRQLYVPHGFAHGFSVLSERAVISYKCDNLYRPEYERGIRPDDPALGIDWRIDVRQAILSARDRAGKTFADSEKL